MSEQPKKARDIKDLKARLARPSAAAPGVGPGPVSGIPAPMPMPGGAPGPGIPRGQVPAPFGAPPAGGPAARGPSDPFAPPAAAPSARPAPGSMPGGLPSRPPTMPPGRSVPPGMMPGVAPTPSAPPAGPADPFAAAPVAAAGPREVRLVIDDKAVSDDEIGRKSSGKILIAVVAAAAVSLVAGWFVGSTVGERKIYAAALADGKELYAAVNTASPTVEKAAQLIDQALKSAAPGAGKTTEVDFKALEELRKLSKPFPADVFSRKKYAAFNTSTVDALFTYYNNTNLLWAKITSVAGRALSPTGREGLTRAAKAAGELANTEFGCVPFKDGEVFGCGLVSVNKAQDGKLTVVTRGGTYPKEAFTGQDLKAKTSDYVIMIDKGRSNEILGAQTNMFQTFARDLMEMKTLSDQTQQMQGTLVKELGEIAKLQ